MNTKLPAPTASTAISGLIDQLKDELREKDYGKVGLIFTIHNSMVTKYEKIDITLSEEGL